MQRFPFKQGLVEAGDDLTVSLGADDDAPRALHAGGGPECSIHVASANSPVSPGCHGSCVRTVRAQAPFIAFCGSSDLGRAIEALTPAMWAASNRIRARRKKVEI